MAKAEAAPENWGPRDGVHAMNAKVAKIYTHSSVSRARAQGCRSLRNSLGDLGGRSRAQVTKGREGKGFSQFLVCPAVRSCTQPYVLVSIHSCSRLRISDKSRTQDRFLARGS